MKNRVECLAEYGSDYKIQQMAETGKLFRVGKALYSEEEHAPELAVLARQYPKAVATMRNALLSLLLGVLVLFQLFIL